MRQRHGVWSLILIFLAVTVGTISIALVSKLAAFIYIIISLLSFMLIVYSFCTKCTCRQHECGHVLPGKFTKLLPVRVEGPYGKGDYFGVLIPLLFIIGMPQIWLVDRLQLMVIFWILLIAAGIEIALKVCKGCGNRCCPINTRLY